MAENQTPFQVHDYEPETAPGKYDEEVAFLAEQNRASLAAGGKRKAIDVLVPADKVAAHKRYFQSSAKNYRDDDAPDGFTARATNEQPQGDSSVLVTFVLGERVIRKKGASEPRQAGTDETDEDTPEELPAKGSKAA